MGHGRDGRLQAHHRALGSTLKRTVLASIGLPHPPSPIGAYARGTIHNGIGMISGQFPLVNGAIPTCGRLGSDLTVAEGRDAARVAALNEIGRASCRERVCQYV